MAFAAAVSLSTLAGVDVHSNSASSHDASMDASPTKENTDVTILSRGASLPLLLSLSPTSTPSLRPSASPSESIHPSALPSTNPSTSLSPSISPSITPSQSMVPTQSLVPTVSSVPSTSSKPSWSNSPSSSPTLTPTLKPTSLQKFRLRLHWQPGYYWQESRDESWFCLACVTCDNNIFNSSCDLQETCQEGMLLGLVGCEPGKGGKISAVDFVIKRNLFQKRYEGDMISLYKTDLCVARKGRNVFLENCSGNKNQLWVGFNPDKEFELQPAGKKGSGKCLTQHHHPKRGERIFAEKCTTARKTTTSTWTTF